MRKIIFISLFATLFITACKKEAIETKAPADSDKVTFNAPVPCTGNTWGDEQVYKAFFYDRPLIYNNKAYIFRHEVDRLLIFDGTSWDSIPMFIPFNTNPYFVFTIGNKGYLGGYFGDFSAEKYFWEYNFTTNTWSGKATFPGDRRASSSTFTIGNKGYLVGGYIGLPYPDNVKFFKDTWEYNSSTDSWEQKANLPHIRGIDGIAYAAGFSIGNKGYILNGTFRQNFSFSPIVYLPYLLEYNPVTDVWSFKASFPGPNQVYTNAFVIGQAVYAGGGSNSVYNIGLPEYYKYSPATDAWVSIASFPASNNPGFSFSINSRGYVVYNMAGSTWPTPFHMYKYTPKICNPQGTSQ